MSLPPTMSGANSGKPSSGNYPPPAPGGPPADSQGKPAPNQIPAYNPAAPAFAAPPSRADSDIYNATDDEAPPPMPTRPGHGHPAAGTTGTTTGPAAAAPAATKSKFSLSSFSQKLTGGINQLANKMGSEGFLPDSLDVECEKAARTLKAFCKEGLDPETAAEAPPHTLDVPPNGRPTSSGRTSPDPKADKKRKSSTLVHIPTKAFSRAVGLAIFTNARAAYFVTGSIGSGVLISRLPNGGWSAPAGIHVRIGGVGAAAGADIFDCVVIFNSRETLDSFTRTGSITLGGGGVSLAAGKWGAGGNLDFAASDATAKGKGKGKEGEAVDGSHPVAGDKPAAVADSKLGQPPASAAGDGKQRSRSPFPGSAVVSYVRSRGLYGGIQVDGTVLSERKNENARFYNQEGITVAQILSKDAAEPAAAAATHPWQKHAHILLEAVRSAEGYRAGSDPNTPLDPPTTLMSNVRLGGDNSAAAPPPAAPVGDSKVGAPQSTWTAPTSAPQGASIMPGGGAFPPPPPGPPPNVAPAMANWKAEEAAKETAAAAQQAGGSSFPPPPPGPPPNVGPAMVQWKQDEAAREAAGNSQANAPPPPSYSQFDTTHSAPPPPQAGGSGQASDLPPAYVDDGGPKPGVGDSKTGRH
ncbi:hypothetical protein RB600_001870 [Gaeumannomyces tritici]